MNAKELRDAFHYLYPDELPALQRLAQMLPSSPIVVNIGAGAGTSGLAFLEAREDLYLVTIDIQKESSPYGCLAGEEDVLRKAGLWGKRNKQIHSPSIQAAKEWNWTQVDMVFIDGDHTFEGCRGDITSWLPLLKPGGIMAVHDYKKHLLPVDYNNYPHPAAFPGVDQAVDEFLLAEGEMILWEWSLIAVKVK